MLLYIKGVQSTKVHIFPRLILKIWLDYRDFQLSNMSSGLEYLRDYNYSVGTALFSSMEMGTTEIYIYILCLCN